ncbi:MAG: SprT family zinc-dependent metalloprotease [Victivallaceae bacterium]|nr:SprT family zinc-dependent metalloprotease [Victivallaceae bacterium]
MTGVEFIRSSRRRRFELRVRPEDGVLEVRMPAGCSDAEALRLLELHRPAVDRLRRRAAELAAKTLHHTYCEGDVFPYLGQDYPLRFSRRVSSFDQAFIVPAGPPDEVRSSLENLYRRLALEYLKPLTFKLAERHGLTVKRVRVGGAVARWGSCSRSGSINYTWRLILKPPAEVEDVVLHELAHRTEFNHSPRFWSLLEVYRRASGIGRSAVQRSSNNTQ